MKVRNGRHRVLNTIALSALIAVPAAGQCINEDLKLTAFNAAGSDEFGVSVAVSGTIAVIGARTDGSGDNSGSAYVFDLTNGQQLFQLTAADAAGRDQFGISVAVYGTTAIIGAPEDDDAGGDSGSAYLFDMTTGQQLIKLTASDAAANDQFGVSVGISGTIAIVGAWSDDDAGSAAGSAYLFDTITGQQLFKLTASDAASGDRFGNSVAVSGNTAIVGARFNDDGGSASGSAYLFDTTTGQQLFKLTAADAAPGDRFGVSVATDGVLAVIGASENDDAGSNSGSAYLFDIATGQQIFKLTASDAMAADEFGSSVAVSGGFAVVGASRNDDGGAGSGSAYAFDTGTGRQVFKLLASDAAAQDQFGHAVAFSDGTGIVGAWGDDSVGTNSGSAYVFDLAAAEPCLADWNADCSINFFDVSAFLAAYDAQDPSADLAPPFGSWNFFDVSAYLVSFNTPCP